MSFGTNNDVASLWKDFSENGTFSTVAEGEFVSGAISGTVDLLPGETKEVTLVMGWYFPERDFFGLLVGELGWIDMCINLFCTCTHLLVH